MGDYNIMRVKMKLVDEVAFIRPILILFLVVYHAFLIYGGGWAQPVGYVDIPLYKEYMRIPRRDKENGALQPHVRRSGKSRDQLFSAC